MLRWKTRERLRSSATRSGSSCEPVRGRKGAPGASRGALWLRRGVRGAAEEETGVLVGILVVVVVVVDVCQGFEVC